ncbi:hypothetical protein MSKU3_3310 [Komagataeibacter oboediens]|nr:hypothetical protein MSKU3_3310 [Komagataeibacter oboediens]
MALRTDSGTARMPAARDVASAASASPVTLALTTCPFVVRSCSTLSSVASGSMAAPLPPTYRPRLPGRTPRADDHALGERMAVTAPAPQRLATARPALRTERP